ncbi:MAG: B12-binding domain-containing radical SAM protein [Candidatus Thiosymbion ectosymbiont of Robbea hypermnestra]|nr:B12-binding domain-containing radical SAM protein [Candidatus Thiosymbion ectosymbiont of Robbea hypermnestra]
MTRKPKVTLIAVEEYSTSMSVRLLSALLKQAGYETLVIFVRGMASRAVAMGQARVFDDAIHDEIAALAAGSLYIGFSVRTRMYHAARELTTGIRSRLDIPIIWGGAHAIVRPDECLELADMVCVGEGEALVVELADRLREQRAYRDIPGLWVRGESPVTPWLQTDLSHLPLPDCACDGSHYFVYPRSGRAYEILRIEDSRAYDWLLGGEYYFAPTRGCLYKCTYCTSNKYAQIYKELKAQGQAVRRLRVRDPDAVIRELIWAKDRFSLSCFITADDCFVGLKTDEIRYLAAQYKKHIGLPLMTGGNLVNLTEEKLQALCDAGLTGLVMGLQTGSEGIRELYGREWEKEEKLLDQARLVNRFMQQGKIRRVTYQLIVDNPWESHRDRMDTLRLVASLPRPFSISLHSLTFFPGTPLYERALSEKLIRGDALDGAYWRSLKHLNPTPVNETLSLIKLLPLSPTLLWWLASERPFAAVIRRVLLRLVIGAPELTLFFKSPRRHEIDVSLRSGEQDLFRALDRERPRISSTRARAKWALRRFLLWTYVQSHRALHWRRARSLPCDAPRSGRG